MASPSPRPTGGLRSWLTENKIFFETVVMTTVAVAAVIVSVVQLRVGSAATELQSSLITTQNEISTTQALLVEAGIRAEDARVVDQFIDRIESEIEPTALNQEAILLSDNLQMRLVSLSKRIQPYRQLELSATDKPSGTLTLSPLLSREKARLIQILGSMNINLAGKWHWYPVDARYCDFRNSSPSALKLMGLDFRHSDFSGSVLQGTDFSSCNLSHTIFTSADLRGTILIGVRLHNAQLSGANLKGVIVEEGWIDRCRSTEPLPRGVNWDHWEEVPVSDEEAFKIWASGFLRTYYKPPPSIKAAKSLAVLQIREGVDEKTEYPDVQSDLSSDEAQ